MRTASALCLLSCVAATATPAQEKKQSVEIGTSVGVTIVTQSGETVTAVGIPVAQGAIPILSTGTIYMTIFATRSVMIEPQATLTVISGGGASIRVFGVAAQTGYLFTPLERHSAYVAANVGLQHFGGDAGSATGVGLGGAIGYRVRAGAGFAVRFEGRFRHWVADFDGVNEIGFGIGLGGII